MLPFDLSTLPALFGPSVATIIGLIFLDVVLGLAAALRLGQFDLEALARFYRTQVLPALLGYVALSAATAWVAPALLGDAAELVSGTAITFAWAAVVGSLAASIRNSIMTLYYKKDEWERDFDTAVKSLEEEEGSLTEAETQP